MPERMSMYTYNLAEREAINNYEKRFTYQTAATPSIYNTDTPDTNHRCALAVVRYAIENVLQWTPQEALTMFTFDIMLEMKLRPEWNKLKLPRDIKLNKEALYIITLLYPQYKALYSEERSVIATYRNVIEQRRGIFPKEYFADERGYYRGCVCLRYMLNQYMQYPSINDMYEEFADVSFIKDFLDKYGLSKPCDMFFGSKPIEYLHAALPVGQKSELLKNFYDYQYINGLLKKHGKDAKKGARKPRKKKAECSTETTGE